MAGLYHALGAGADRLCLWDRRSLPARPTAGWLHGLKIVAVAVVAQAVWGMARSLCPDRERATIAVLASTVTLAWPTAVGQLSSIAIAGGIFVA